MGKLVITYKRPHKIPNIDELLRRCLEIAKFAVKYKNKFGKKPSCTQVDYTGVGSHIATQVMKKYASCKQIKTVKNICAVVNRNSGDCIKFDAKLQELYIVPLGYHCIWSPGRPIKQVNQIEIKRDMMYIAVEIEEPKLFTPEQKRVIGVDLNASGHIAVAANLATEKVRFFGKDIPAIRKKYRKMRQNAQRDKDYKKLREMSGREQRKIRDMQHKISLQIVEWAVEQKCAVVIEDLTNIRTRANKNPALSSSVRDSINTWSFGQLGGFIQYKCQLAGVPCYKIDPHYTSQLCSYCNVQGDRSKKNIKQFKCDNKNCIVKNGKTRHMMIRHADVNAAYNIAKRYKDVTAPTVQQEEKNSA